MTLTDSLQTILAILVNGPTQQTAVTLPERAEWPQANAAPLRAMTSRAARETLAETDMRLLRVKLASLCQTPIKHVDVLERYGRILLVSFIPHGSIDPVMPVTFLPLGDEHDAAWRQLAALLQAWSPNMLDIGTTQRRWYIEAQSFARTAVRMAMRHLTANEARYYAEQLFYTVANPARHN